jgi:hypothetical protein
MRPRKVMAAAGIGLACLMITATAPAQSDTTGKVTIESTTVALGIGVAWGDGTLVYRGKEYKFNLDGLSVGDLGVSKVQAKGTVANLKTVEDFEGKYAAASAAGAASLRLTMETAGVDVKLKK